MSLRVSTLVLLVLVSILLPTYGKEIGEECSSMISCIISRPGICTPMKDCSIYSHLLNRKMQATEIYTLEICKVTLNEIIVCCPAKLVSTVSTLSSTAMPIKTVKPLMFNPEIEGSLAQAKCAENAEAVYDWVRSVRVLNQSSVNVSQIPRCALINEYPYAAPKEFLHVATLGYNTSEGTVWDCIGSLISAKIVLTTAGCTEEQGDLKWIKMGPISRRDKIKEKLQIIEIEEIIIHPEYKWPHHDIAILRLKHEVNYNEWVRPACLSVNSSDVREGNKVFDVAWDLSYFEENYTEWNLVKTTVRINPNNICRNDINIDKWKICATREYDQDELVNNFFASELLFGFNFYECIYNVIGITDIYNTVHNVYNGVHNYISWIEKTAWPEYF